MCGTGPVGGELYALVGGSAFVFEMDAQELPVMQEAILAAYTLGMQEGRAKIDPEDIRLGFSLWSALWWGVGIPPLMGHWTQEEKQEAARLIYEHSPEEICTQWASLGEYALNLADEARGMLEQRSW